MKSNLYYPKEVWEFKGLRQELDRLCAALKRIETARQRMSEIYSKGEGLRYDKDED